MFYDGPSRLKNPTRFRCDTCGDVINTARVCGKPGCIRPQLEAMTWDKWQRLSESDKATLRDTSELHPDLVPYRGYRVEVEYYGERKRFIIGQTTGWKPATLGMHNRRSMGSSNLLTPKNCKLLRIIERVR
jgi:hypothetical protein